MTNAIQDAFIKAQKRRAALQRAAEEKHKDTLRRLEEGLIEPGVAAAIINEIETSES